MAAVKAVSRTFTSFRKTNWTLASGYCSAGRATGSYSGYPRGLETVSLSRLGVRRSQLDIERRMYDF